MNVDDRTKARFVNGLLLAWIPFVFFFAPMAVTFVRELSPQKATGLGAVAGGLSEGLITFGLAAIVVTQVGAIVLLARSFWSRSCGSRFLLRSLHLLQPVPACFHGFDRLAACSAFPLRSRQNDGERNLNASPTRAR